METADRYDGFHQLLGRSDGIGPTAIQKHVDLIWPGKELLKTWYAAKSGPVTHWVHDTHDTSILFSNSFHKQLFTSWQQGLLRLFFGKQVQSHQYHRKILRDWQRLVQLGYEFLDGTLRDDLFWRWHPSIPSRRCVLTQVPRNVGWTDHGTGAVRWDW